jgi:exodeoxyribonuclease V alpha subunit
MVKISGFIERITYYNEENGYTVLRLRPEKSMGKRIPGLDLNGLLTVIGNLPALSPGEQVNLEGDYTTHVKHGLQFSATHCEQVLPASVQGIEKYLGSGLIRGIGPGLAKRIVNHYKEKTLEIIEEDPQKLMDVPGIGNDRTEKIIQAWEEMRHVKEIMLFLHSHNISTNLAVKIYKTYGNESLQTVKENPYKLEEDIYGIGFKTADRIAQNLGLPKDHPSRIEAGIVYSINESINDGHVYSTENELIERASEILEADKAIISEATDRLQSGARIVKDSPSSYYPTKIENKIGASTGDNALIIYLAPYFHSERGLARRIQSIMSSQTEPKQFMLIGGDQNLSGEQKKAVETALISPISVITGGPGTGKTTCLKSLIQMLEFNNVRFALVSPTGRAAKRLSEATGKPASTIHRCLGYNPGEGFKYHEKNQLKIDFLIIDEASMLDLLLAYHLLKAIRDETQILFVGDVDQLPSVGAGDVLGNLILSGKIPVTRLTKIYRQSSTSEIITNAHRINQGHYPIFSSGLKGDFFLFPAEDSQKAADWVLDVIANRIPDNFGMDPINDIQVLTPMYRGASGVSALNEMLQEKLNPPSNKKPEQNLFGKVLRIGDKVMQTKNNYDKEVFNGDIGFIHKIDKVDQKITIMMDQGRPVTYDFSETDEIVLAYAITVHKSQGSEFPAVVIPILTQHYIMLQRNLLYTAVTRAEKLCVLVGNPKAIRIAIHNNQYAHRNSLLAERINQNLE